jgi:hypothetical protein
MSNRVAIFAGLLLGTLAPAAAQTTKGTVLVFAKGSCTRFVVSGKSYPCQGVIYTQFPNGRIAWNVPMPEGALMLAGGRDSQIDPKRYVLQIDKIRAGRADGSSDGYPAKGRCTANLSSDGVYLHSLSCRASNGLEDVYLEFKGDGSPVDRKSL